jgi:hypothetical protein
MEAVPGGCKRINIPRRGAKGITRKSENRNVFRTSHESCALTETFPSGRLEAYALFQSPWRSPQNQDVNIRLLALGLACGAGVYGQHHFSWQESCFNNPGLPYCPGHDFAVKPTKGGKSSSTSAGTLDPMSPTVDAAGIDWRFADPSAEALAVLTGAKLSASPVAHSLIEQLGASEGLAQADVQNIFRALSGIGHVALSIREDRILLLVTGRAPDAILPAPQAGWKAVPLGNNTILIGRVDAVEHAVQRLAIPSPLGELASTALGRQVDSDFWLVGSATMVRPEAVAAGVKQFLLTASLEGRLISDTAYQFDGVPDTIKIKPWLSTLADPTIEGNAVHVRVSMEAGETGQSFSQIAASPLGQHLGVFIKSARYLPLRDTATTVHTKPVIFGLDDGAREVSSAPPPSDGPASVSRAQAVTDLSGTWGFTHADDHFRGWIVLQQSGSIISGTWHTSFGKSEPDDTISGRVDGNTVTIWRLIGNNRQNFVLTLSADGSRLDGFGDGFFLNHTNLNMQRQLREH